MIFLTEQKSPPWLIFLLDVFLCGIAIVVAYLLRFNFQIPPGDLVDMPYVIGVILFVRSISFLVARIPSAVIRYTSTGDALRIFSVLLAGTLFFILIDGLTFYLKGYFLIPFSIFIIEFLVTSFLMLSVRTLIKVLYFERVNPSREKTPVIIFGTGEAGLITKRTLDRDAGNKYKPVAFLSDEPGMTGKKIEGVRVFALADFKKLARELKPGFLIFASSRIEPEQKQNLLDEAIRAQMRILNVPDASHWINGQLSFKQIRKIKPEELIERKEISVNMDRIRATIENKIVLVTGAAGSIGSELARQLIFCNPGKLILLDQAESDLYDLMQEIGMQAPRGLVHAQVGDINNQTGMLNLFKSWKPEVVFHAAAYKHVPLMEENPAEALRTNTLGTKILTDLALEFKTAVFVFISSDKAVNPTGIMGASKRAAETYVQSAAEEGNTLFITTRFGNVLGSRGSVIPLFKKQIERGGPLTITHPEITRYFMTIPEAVRLVLEASAMGRDSEIFLFDMGQPVKIYDLALKMISLYGLKLDKDIRIVFTGLRPGEKLYEELLNQGENVLPTHHPLIRIARVSKTDRQVCKAYMEKLETLLKDENPRELVLLLKSWIPEYISNNSPFEQYDRKPEASDLLQEPGNGQPV